MTNHTKQLIESLNEELRNAQALGYHLGNMASLRSDIAAAKRMAQTEDSNEARLNA